MRPEALIPSLLDENTVYNLQQIYRPINTHLLEGFVKVKFRQSIYVWQTQLQFLLVWGGGKNTEEKKKFQCDFSKWGLVLHSSLMLLSEEVYWNYCRNWLLRFNSDFYLILRFILWGSAWLRGKKINKDRWIRNALILVNNCVALGCQHDNTTKLTVCTRFLLRSDTRCPWLNWST